MIIAILLLLLSIFYNAHVSSDKIKVIYVDENEMNDKQIPLLIENSATQDSLTQPPEKPVVIKFRNDPVQNHPKRSKSVINSDSAKSLMDLIAGIWLNNQTTPISTGALNNIPFSQLSQNPEKNRWDLGIMNQKTTKIKPQILLDKAGEKEIKFISMKDMTLAAKTNQFKNIGNIEKSPTESNNKKVFTPEKSNEIIEQIDIDPYSIDNSKFDLLNHLNELPHNRRKYGKDGPNDIIYFDSDFTSLGGLGNISIWKRLSLMNTQEFIKEYGNSTLLTSTTPSGASFRSNVIFPLIEGNVTNLNMNSDYFTNKMAKTQFPANLVIENHAACKPRIKCVDVSQEMRSHNRYWRRKHGSLFWPFCIEIERCGGCCLHTCLNCKPTEKVLQNYTLIEIQMSYDPGTKNYRINIKGTYETQFYRHVSCSCECNNKTRFCADRC